ncbi:MAG: type II secretion system protein GspL [Pseudomonadales bacterium]|nr:type II secretion system protein GspL [Pseudomonadales bacterium]
MADASLIYLSGAPDAPWQPQSTVLYQSRPGEPVQAVPLEQAFASASGPVNVVVSVASAQLTRVSLSRKQAKHLQRVLPYLLEEQLLDNPEDLWFVSRKGEGDDYQVTAVARELLTLLREQAEQHDVQMTSVQVDAERLQSFSPLIADLGDDQWLLVADRERALVADAQQRDAIVPLFGDDLDAATELPDADSLFSALRGGQGLELLTGEYAPRQQRSQAAILGPWRPVLMLAASVLVLSLVAIWVQQWRYQKAADAAFAQAQQTYESLFPGDKATSALKRQFQGRLARLGGGEGGGSAFFPLLVPVAEVLKQVKVEPKRLQYDQRQNTLLLDVGAKDYAQLEALQNAIKKQGARASIANYRNGAQGVSARIKVEQPG